MKEYVMQEDWRTVQLFLTQNAIAEVEINSMNNSQVRCNCLGFGKIKGCNHVKFVKNHMKGNDGHYTVQIPVEVDDEVASVAVQDAALFRQFIIDYGKVEVID